MLTKLFVNAQLTLDSIKNSASNFANDERGVTAIEYSIIAAVMGIGIYVGLTDSGLVTNIKSALATVASDIGKASS